jgi:hypothetical protein
MQISVLHFKLILDATEMIGYSHFNFLIIYIQLYEIQ